MRRAAVLVAIGVIAFAAYSRSFSSPFHFDDYGQILENPAVRTRTVAVLWFWGRSRVIPYATLALNFRLGEENPFGYHVVNFTVHLLATLAVFALATVLCRTPALCGTVIAKRSLLFATAAALVFACHPIQVQAITYIVQRTTAMMSMFYIAAVAAYVHGRNTAARWAFGFAIIMGVAALFSKESAASLPLAIVLVEWVFYPGPAQRARLLRLVPVLLVVLLIPVPWLLLTSVPDTAPTVTGRVTAHLQVLFDALRANADPYQRTTPLQYFGTQCLVIPRYLALVFLPWGFNVDPDVPFVTGISPPVVAGFLLLAALAAFGVYAVRRRPLVGFGVLWVFVALSVESSIVPISDAMMEHRMYLAMPGIALGLASVYVAASLRAPRAAAIGGVAVVGVLVALTIARNEVWRSSLSLWEDALVKSPNKARVQVNLGASLHQLDRLDEAITHYCRALEIEPHNREAEYNLEAAVEARGFGAEAAGDDDEGGDGMVLTVEDARAACKHN